MQRLIARAVGPSAKGLFRLQVQVVYPDGEQSGIYIFIIGHLLGF